MLCAANGASSCKACDIGKTTSSGSEKSACTACEPGTVAPATASAQCEICEKGKFNNYDPKAGEIASEVVQRSKQLHGDRQPKESLGVMLRLRDLRMHTIPPDAGVRLVHGQSARR